MRKILFSILISISCILALPVDQQSEKKIPLDSSDGLELVNVKSDIVEHMGKKGIQITKIEGENIGETLVIIPDISFKNGSIAVELTGQPAPDADPQMRGFVGLAFRVDPSNYSSYECIYLRPTNARADNQVRRNHSTQYISHPEFPWYRLRNENPGLYESYVDLNPDEWTKIKIEVNGQVAKLYVHDAAQPCLIVNDLKKGESEGKVALWLHSSTLARYRNLIIKSESL